MQVTVEQLRQFAYCPKLPEQNINNFSGDREIYQRLVTYVFRHDLEKNEKLGFESLEKRWRRFYFQDKKQSSLEKQELQAYNRSLIALKAFHKWYLSIPASSVVSVNYSFQGQIYGHEIIGNLPVLLQLDTGVLLLTTESISDSENFVLDPAIRFMALGVNEELTVVGIINACIFECRSFEILSFAVTPRYLESALLDFTNLVESMQRKTTYVNSLGCGNCIARNVCTVLKGHG